MQAGCSHWFAHPLLFLEKKIPFSSLWIQVGGFRSQECLGTFHLLSELQIVIIKTAAGVATEGAWLELPEQEHPLLCSPP